MFLRWIRENQSEKLAYNLFFFTFLPYIFLFKIQSHFPRGGGGGEVLNHVEFYPA